MSSEPGDRGALVSTALLTARNIGNALIEVEDAGGTITLRGAVETEEARIVAELLAQEQEGVVQVVNKLKVSDL